MAQTVQTGPPAPVLLFLRHAYRPATGRLARAHRQLLFRVVSLARLFQFLALELGDQEHCSHKIKEVYRCKDSDRSVKRIFRG
jgi:hypothetical protein